MICGSCGAENRTDRLFAAAMGDLSVTEANIEALAAKPLQFDLVVAFRRLLEAALAARTGRLREASHTYIEATETLTRVGNAVIAVLGELDAVAMLPRDDPASRRAVEHLRSFVAATGALAIERRLEEVLSGPRSTPLPPAADQSAEAAPPQNVRTTS